MKKLILSLLIVSACAQAQAQIIQDAQAILSNAFTYTKTLVAQHPYLTAGAVCVGAAVIVACSLKSKTTTAQDVVDDTVIIHKPAPLRKGSVTPPRSPLATTSPSDSPTSKLDHLSQRH